MSREILFKAKRKNWREIPKEEWWIEGLPIEIKEKLYISTEYDGIDDKTDFGMVQFIIQKSLIEIDPETLCQYTGLNDKNGKKIWENDIVDGHTKRGAAFWRSVVLWNEYKARFDVRTMDCNFPMTLDEVVDDISVNGPDYVVIGNIFDNPELLEDSDLKEKKMEVRIWPGKPDEKGGYAMMPMKKNVPNGGPEWKLTTCPECGKECWEMPALREIIGKEVTALCTECALKKVRVHGKKTGGKMPFLRDDPKQQDSRQPGKGRISLQETGVPEMWHQMEYD